MLLVGIDHVILPDFSQTVNVTYASRSLYATQLSFVK